MTDRDHDNLAAYEAVFGDLDGREQEDIDAIAEEMAAVRKAANAYKAAKVLADAGYGLHDTDTARRMRMLMGVYQPRYTPLELGSAHCNASGARLGVDDLRARLDAAEDEAWELRQLLGVGP